MTKKVWITRTEPSASRLATTLQQSGYDPLVAPVMEIIPVGSSLPSADTDIWVFVSSHAVHQVSKRPWDKTKTTIAVGPTTAAQLKPLGISPLVPSQHSSEGLYELIRTRFAHDLRITIVAGRSGRKDLIKWLNSDGYCCQEWIVYDRKSTDFQIGDEHVDAIVITSAFALSNVRKQYSSERFVSIPIVVPSPRFAELAKSMQFHDVRIADGPTDTATLDALNATFVG